MDFYWIDGGTELSPMAVTVTYTVTIGGKAVSSQVTFNVLRPTATFTAVLTTDNPPVQTSADVGNDLPMAIHFGSFASEGITWTGEVTVPAGGAGEIATTQLISTWRRLQDADGVFWNLSSGGLSPSQYICDDRPNKPAGKGYVNDYSRTPVLGGETATCVSADSPSQGVQNGDRWVAVADEFENYLMYKPAGNDSIWVTLSVLTWYWGGIGTWDGQKWVTSSITTPSQAPTGSNSTILPEWNNFFMNLKPEPE